MALDGKLALVTGGASGIGQAVCQLFAAEGARVVASDVNGKGLDETMKLMQKQSVDKRHLSVVTDVSSSKSVDDLAQKIQDFYDGEIPTVIVHIAGIIRNLLGIEKETEDLFDKVISVNLKGTYLVNRKFALLLKERKLAGSVVNISSIAIHGLAAGPAYAASKGGVSSLTKSFAKELAKFNIRFNTVKPGVIDTPLPFTANVPQDEMSELNSAKCIAPMGRQGSPKEVAEVCLFLASEKSSYVTCSEYEVHGGLQALVGDAYR